MLFAYDSAAGYPQGPVALPQMLADAHVWGPAHHNIHFRYAGRPRVTPGLPSRLKRKPPLLAGVFRQSIFS